MQLIRLEQRFWHFGQLIVHLDFAIRYKKRIPFVADDRFKETIIMHRIICLDGPWIIKI